LTYNSIKGLRSGRCCVMPVLQPKKLGSELYGTWIIFLELHLVLIP
jgi:hypothetical protein